MDNCSTEKNRNKKIRKSKRPFPTKKHFVSYFGLCPNNEITGGRIRKKRTRCIQSRTAHALRLSAQSKSALGAFYRRMRARHGAAKANVATAHKLAKIKYRNLQVKAVRGVMLWISVFFGQPDSRILVFDKQYRLSSTYVVFASLPEKKRNGGGRLFILTIFCGSQK